MGAKMLKRALAAYSKCAIGLSFFLAWVYCSFFSCGLVPNLIIRQSVERAFPFLGVTEALVGVVALLVASRLDIASRKSAVMAGCVCASAGSLFIWLSYFFAGELFPVFLAIGGSLSGVGVALLVLLWGKVLSGYDEHQIELSVVVSFVIAVVLYLVLLFAKEGPFVYVFLLVDMAFPVISVTFALKGESFTTRRAPLPLPSQSEKKVLLRQFATMFLLFGMLWFQFIYFRVISAPPGGDRFVHYLIPFLCAFLLTAVALRLCIAQSRYVNFTLVFRWSMPLIVISYGILFVDYHNPVLKVAAYTANFAAMLGAQLACWISIAKRSYRNRLPIQVIMGGMIIAEGIGIVSGVLCGLYVFDGGFADKVVGPSLLLVGVLLGTVMVIGFNPTWLFSGAASSRLSGGGRKAAEAGSVVDDRGDADRPDADFPHDGDPGRAEEVELRDLLKEEARNLQKSFGLTARETEIAALLLEGRNRPYIRDELIIALNTVHAHVRSIYAKCGVHSQQELMRLVRGESTDQGSANGAVQRSAEVGLSE